MTGVLRTLGNLLMLAVVIMIGYHYRADLIRAKDILFRPAPCTRPIRYSIGTFDTRFGITREQLLADLRQAESVWETAEGKPLFTYTPDSGSEVAVNLIYDYRQQATEKLQSIGSGIDADKATYDSMKVKYDTLSSQYAAAKASLETLQAEFDSQKAAYDQKVAYWNSRGGAPKDEYQSLQAEHDRLAAFAHQINQKIAALNALADSANSTGSMLNALAASLNLNVKKYNTIGASTGPEFDEGEYIENRQGRRINIYQFNGNDMLVRVLAHELGHALGLEHVSDSEAIMYYKNHSTNSRATKADVAELHRVCATKERSQ